MIKVLVIAPVQNCHNYEVLFSAATNERGGDDDKVRIGVGVRKTQGFEGCDYLSQTKLMRATRNEFDLVILTDSQKENKNKPTKEVCNQVSYDHRSYD